MRAIAIGLLSLYSAASLVAQDETVHVTLVAHGGVLAQTVAFRQDFGALVPGLVSGHRFDHGRSLGASLELGRARSPLGVRFALNRASALTLENDPGYKGAPLYGPASGTITTATIAVLLEPRQTCFGPFCPRLLLGGGIKRYRFKANVRNDDVIEPFADDQDRPTLQLGIGVRATVSGFVLIADISDFSNGLRFGNATYPSKRTHDTIVSLGLGIRLPRCLTSACASRSASGRAAW